MFFIAIEMEERIRGPVSVDNKAASNSTTSVADRVISKVKGGIADAFSDSAPLSNVDNNCLSSISL
jgi:hypothetical protein